MKTEQQKKILKREYELRKQQKLREDEIETNRLLGILEHRFKKKQNSCKERKRQEEITKVWRLTGWFDIKIKIEDEKIDEIVIDPDVDVVHNPNGDELLQQDIYDEERYGDEPE